MYLFDLACVIDELKILKSNFLYNENLAGFLLFTVLEQVNDTALSAFSGQIDWSVTIEIPTIVYINIFHDEFANLLMSVHCSNMQDSVSTI